MHQQQSGDNGALLLAQQALDAARAEAAAASTRAAAAERALEDTRARLASVSDNVKEVEASLAKEVTAHRDDLAKVAEDKFADASDVTEAMDDLDEDVNKIKAMLEGQVCVGVLFGSALCAFYLVLNPTSLADVGAYQGCPTHGRTGRDLQAECSQLACLCRHIAGAVTQASTLLLVPQPH